MALTQGLRGSIADTHPEAPRLLDIKAAWLHRESHESHLFNQEGVEPSESRAVHQRNMLRVVVDPTSPLLAAKGSIVAYQGNVEFTHKSGGGRCQWLGQASGIHG